MKRYNHWQIAYRPSKNENFILIPNPLFAWAADPFLVRFRGKVYLFAELYLYRSERNGVIGYCEYQDGCFDEWKVTMDKHWHLSYPNVFVYQNELYMCPESNQSEDVSLYRLREFPDKWEKINTFIENEKCVDTTFFSFNNENYMFTFKPNFKKYGGELYLYKIKENRMEVRFITDDEEMARPGGNVLNIDGKYIRVSQNCLGDYGKGLVFSEIDSVWPLYKEHIVKKIFVDDIPINSNKKFIGIHTYNCLDGLEVIDLKYTTFSLQEYIAQKRVRKVFLNKYK